MQILGDFVQDLFGLVWCVIVVRRVSAACWRFGTPERALGCTCYGRQGCASHVFGVWPPFPLHHLDCHQTRQTLLLPRPAQGWKFAPDGYCRRRNWVFQKRTWAAETRFHRLHVVVMSPSVLRCRVIVRGSDTSCTTVTPQMLTRHGAAPVRTTLTAMAAVPLTSVVRRCEAS